MTTEMAINILRGAVLGSDEQLHEAVFMAIKALKEQPAVEHGHWTINRRGNIECSLCGNEPYHDNKKNMNYCPKCGARMDEVKDGIKQI